MLVSCGSTSMYVTSVNIKFQTQPLPVGKNIFFFFCTSSINGNTLTHEYTHKWDNKLNKSALFTKCNNCCLDVYGDVTIPFSDVVGEGGACLSSCYQFWVKKKKVSLWSSGLPLICFFLSGAHQFHYNDSPEIFSIFTKATEMILTNTQNRILLSIYICHKILCQVSGWEPHVWPVKIHSLLHFFFIRHNEQEWEMDGFSG